MNKSKEDYDNEIEQRLLSLMRDNPAKLLSYFLVVLGREMDASNAATMELSQEFDIKKQRYKIQCKSTLKKIARLKTTHP